MGGNRDIFKQNGDGIIEDGVNAHIKGWGGISNEGWHDMKQPGNGI